MPDEDIAEDVEAMTSTMTRSMKSSGDLEVVIAFEPEEAVAAFRMIVVVRRIESLGEHFPS